MAAISEADLEAEVANWLSDLGYSILNGPDIAPDGPAPERATFRDVILEERLRRALERLNPSAPLAAIEEAVSRIRQAQGVTLIGRQQALHALVSLGVEVDVPKGNGEVDSVTVRVIDFAEPSANEWVAVNQLAVEGPRGIRRPDVVLYVNGIPVVILELKSPSKEEASAHSAFRQFQTYKADIEDLLVYTVGLVASDGVVARLGSISADWERFQRWRTMDGASEAPASALELETLVRGALAPQVLAALYRHYLVFEEDGGKTLAKLASYHQVHAVEAGIQETLRATGLGTGHAHGGNRGDQRVGVIWHTQGSGKSLTMVFYTGRVVVEREMANPTVVVLTDRDDLDNQLFATFARCRAVFRQDPVQAESRADLRSLLSVESGGVVFTTIQKFFPEEKGDTYPLLSDRRNIVVVADEAHRSQYDFIDGFARHLRDALPNASFIGFTGTPIEATDANTRAVFGDYISVYDIEQAVKDGATVPIYYESRLAKLTIRDDVRPTLDDAFEEVTEGEELERREKLKSRWAQLEAVVGSDERIQQIAKDLVAHFAQRQAALEGKAMVVCMSRRICVALYDAIRALRPDWHADDDNAGAMKVIMTGAASDPAEYQPHLRSKSRREALASRFRNPKDPFQLVIVRDMWLTGFDAPCLHTMYIDKPMRGHGLMQAIARVNRVFKDKPGGLVVDYLGIADELREALATYTNSRGTGRPTIDQGEAVAAFRKYYEICEGLFHGFAWQSIWKDGTAGARMALIGPAVDHILSLEDGKRRLLGNVDAMSKAFALAVTDSEVQALRHGVAFFQMVRTWIGKKDTSTKRTDEELDSAIRQIVAGAIAGDGIVDVFTAAGLKKPDISVLSDEFLAQVRGMKHRNLAVDVLAKLLRGEIRTRKQTNVVQARSFAELLEQALRKYENRAIETAQVIEELIALAAQMREAMERGDRLGLTDDELAFYDALETSDAAVTILGDSVLKEIAQELTRSLKANVSVDWSQRENVRARLRVLVKRTLRKYGYPPNKEALATDTVLKQAEVLSDLWATV
jgi:type I restriction enzyme R subunit